MSATAEKRSVSVETQQMDPDLTMVIRLLMHTCHWLLQRRAYMCLVLRLGLLDRGRRVHRSRLLQSKKTLNSKGNPTGTLANASTGMDAGDQYHLGV